MKFFSWIKNKIEERARKKRQSKNGFSQQNLLDSMKTLLVHSSHSGVPLPILGICGNVGYYLETEHNVDSLGSAFELAELFEGWEHHSGIFVYPISETPSVGKWKGENIEKRQDLLKYAIAKLEKELCVTEGRK
jgi:hypothetical protein